MILGKKVQAKGGFIKDSYCWGAVGDRSMFRIAMSTCQLCSLVCMQQVFKAFVSSPLSRIVLCFLCSGFGFEGIVYDLWWPYVYFAFGNIPLANYYFVCVVVIPMGMLDDMDSYHVM